MSKVLTCTDFDSTTQTCIAEAWVDQSSIVDYLPTIEQANGVGVAFAGSLILIAFAVRTLKPQRL